MERLKISCKKESLKTPTMDDEARTEEAAPSASLLELPTPTFGNLNVFCGVTRVLRRTHFVEIT